MGLINTQFAECFGAYTGTDDDIWVHYEDTADVPDTLTLEYRNVKTTGDLKAQGDIIDGAGNILGNKVNQVTGKSLIEENFANGIHYDNTPENDFHNWFSNNFAFYGKLKCWDNDDDEHDIGVELLNLYEHTIDTGNPHSVTKV